MTDPTPTPTPHELSDAAAGHVEFPAATPVDLQRLERVRMDLLRVHRALLEAERARYEKVRGRIANNSAFLQLVINDPWFDWLRPMAQLVLPEFASERFEGKQGAWRGILLGALLSLATVLRAGSRWWAARAIHGNGRRR